MPGVMIDESLAGFEAKASIAAAMLKELANEKRLMILCKLLEHGEMSVMALTAEVGLSQSALSQHLARLREENIVGTRREAQQIFYHVADSRVRQILSTLKTVYC
ncbi:ArsR/SmtB family transcription factor [Aestuariivirga sp.]|jgi:DNA-binding transcriptional ArsR family regulator|uniref:ArsR/SmtB family transcription factor n=1 Tax=Aestuariivirga sp. TaxID=2650926 RepID=UPI003782DA42